MSCCASGCRTRAGADCPASILLLTRPDKTSAVPQWGAVERQPRVYDFSGYRAFVQVAKRMGLKLQAVMSFHACGANVGDTAQVPLPAWVLKV